MTRMASHEAPLASPAPPARAGPAPRPALRLRSEFAIAVRLPLDLAVGLFGAHGERAWAGKDWDPRFLRPLPPEDREGSVFLVDHDRRERLGLTTLFDRARGHVRHVFLLGDRCATVIDVHLVARGPAASRVTVVYERTALRPEAEDEVRKLASGDAAQAPEWEASIDAVAPSILRRRPAWRRARKAGGRGLVRRGSRRRGRSSAAR